jgi:hypothetical protein
MKMREIVTDEERTDRLIDALSANSLWSLRRNPSVTAIAFKVGNGGHGFSWEYG